MSKTQPENGTLHHTSEDDREYLYTVLNLPPTATDHEIRERYRQLSVTFHPDKQIDEGKKETATKHFLEIQKAYEVLSDPVRRQAYDLLGIEGIKLVESFDARGLSKEEITSVLLDGKRQIEEAKIDELIRPRSRVVLGLDASPLFEETDLDPGYTILDELRDRFSRVRRIAFSVQHAVQKQVRHGTFVLLTARLGGGQALETIGTSTFLGTVQHQFSPQFQGQVTANLLRFGSFKFKGDYHHQDYTVSTQVSVTPTIIRRLSRLYEETSSVGRVAPLLPVNLAISRRLFPGSNAQGIFSISTTSQGVDMQLSYLSDSYPFDFSAEADELESFAPSERALRLPSRSGLLGLHYWRVGLGITGLLPSLNAEYVLNFSELDIQMRSVFGLSLTGPFAVLGSVWTSEDKKSNVSADVELSAGGVALKLGFSYLYQRFQMPIILSHEYVPEVAFWTTLLPSTALFVAYHFVLKPRNRKRRLEFFRQARRELREARSDLLRQHEETVYLLRDTARRHMQTEALNDGLVIKEAWYGPAERGDDIDSLDIDVTIPVQSLVSKGQLYIPGRRSKAGLQGFYDPVPGVAKSLRIRYTFRDREHYAEIPDYLPVVLPLEEHLVQ